MKKLNWKLPLLLLLVCFYFNAEAVKVKPLTETKAPKSEVKSNIDVEEPVSEVKITKKTLRKQKRMQRKMQRLQRKLAKWTKQSKRFFGGATDNSKFRLGLLCLIGGLGFVILVNIIGLAWFFGFLGGIVAFVGVCLMIWGVLEYTN